MMLEIALDLKNKENKQKLPRNLHWKLVGRGEGAGGGGGGGLSSHALQIWLLFFIFLPFLRRTA